MRIPLVECRPMGGLRLSVIGWICCFSAGVVSEAHAQDLAVSPASPSHSRKLAGNINTSKAAARLDTVRDGSKGNLSTRMARKDRPKAGPGTYVWASGYSSVIGKGLIKTYSVGVEHGIDIDPNVVATFIEETLADKRGWTRSPHMNWGFQRIPHGGIKFVIASPKTVDKQCAPLDTAGHLSCAMHGYISINLNRWADAVWHWTTGIDNYRRYLINHEMGHWLGQTHKNCPKDGVLAPVMMQQTLFLKGCKPNPWPYPNPQRAPRPAKNAVNDGSFDHTQPPKGAGG